MKRLLFMLIGVSLVAASCRKDLDWEKDVWNKNQASNSNVKKTNFLIKSVGASEYAGTSLKSATASSLGAYLKSGDTILYQVWYYFVIKNIGTKTNFVFNWNGTGVNCTIDNGTAKTTHFSSLKTGAVTLVVSADSAGVTLVDTFHLVASNQYPFNPGSSAFILDTAYQISAHKWHYSWSWDANSWDQSKISPKPALLANGTLGNSTWFSYTATWDAKHSGYIKIDFDANDANLDPTLVASTDSASCGNTVMIHTASGQYAQINPGNTDGYYYSAGTTIAIGFIPYKGKLYPINDSPKMNFLKSNDNKVGINSDSVFFNYFGTTDTGRYVHAITNPITGNFVNVKVGMRSHTMWGGTALAPITFTDAAGKSFVIITPGISTGLISPFSSLWNDSIGAIVIQIPPASSLKAAYSDPIMKYRPNSNDLAKLLKEYPALLGRKK